jgi:predicted AAA+ superfamily ATPase
MPSTIPRSIYSPIKNHLFEGKIIVLYGPRQVGKTTLVKKLLQEYQSSDGYFNCEEPNITALLTNRNPQEIITSLGEHRLIVLDEAQTIPQIGRTLKILIDKRPDLNLIATASSSFELANKTNEPLTGRKYEFFLYPLSLSEIYPTSTPTTWPTSLSQHLVYGMYPTVVTATPNRREEILRQLTSSYLFKDIFTFEEIKSPEILHNLLRAIAFQIGGEVSYSELANLIGIDKKTVAKYLSFLEQSFIIFRHQPLTKNRRDEIKKLRKFYFYDLGLRNALISNFNDLTLRDDLGRLWENFLAIERKKTQDINSWGINNFYWRLQRGSEIDWVEEFGGKFYPYEFKWQKYILKTNNFQNIYPEAQPTIVINQENFTQFLTKKIPYAHQS